ncbi:hypothetical protein IP91_03114 [Pseudoduganella lurida]|uniref:Uncharacterized protein n=1 Tax=Pseudoduganella lurida TaxID=1036180 RepID=A0A562R5K1_9BURK|nr:hypothetical protein IP91_03114 [Pseudoduganella lurida]
MIAWRLFARIRRNFGRQTLSVARQRFSLFFMPLLALGMGCGAVAQGAVPYGLVPGIAAGLALGWYALAKMQLHAPAPGGAFCYTPNPYIGTALTLALVGRMAYRFGPMLLGGEAPTGTSQLTFTTLAMVGMLLAYYWTVAFGLLRWRRQVLAG